MHYRKEIDGLRAIAVIPVILFHAGFEIFSGGFVGVDIFFVISGYLITSIILSEIQAGSFSLVSFYERRVRRILPPLFFVVLSCIPFAWFWMQPKQLENFGQSLMAVVFFVSNFLFWKEKGYFEPLVDEKPLLHTWSLAVEEQYYVLFPLLVLLLWPYGKRNFVFVISILAAASLILSQWGSYNIPSANFYLLPFRAWEILAGALCAIYLTTREVKSNDWLSALGFGLILFSVFTFDETTPFPSFYGLVPVAGVSLLVLFCTPQTISGKILSLRPVVFIGLISYSVYLWHQPLFAFARLRSIQEPSVVMYGGLIVLSLLLGYISWRFIEHPFRNRSLWNKRQIFQSAAIASMLVVGIGAAGDISSGFENRSITEQITYADLKNRFGSNPGLGKGCDDPVSLPEVCRTSDDPEIIVWGDSYAMHLVKGIVASKPDVKLVQMTKSVCGPFAKLAPILMPDYNEKWAEGCLEFNGKVLDWIKNSKSVKYAVLSSPFKQYVLPKSEYYGARGHTKFDLSLVLAEFKETLSVLKENGIKPVVFAPPPSNDTDLGQCLAKSVMFGFAKADCNIEYKDYTEKRMLIISFLKEIEKENQIVWFDKAICQGEICKSSLEAESVFLYRDAGHLSKEGSIFLGKTMNFYQLITN